MAGQNLASKFYCAFVVSNSCTTRLIKKLMVGSNCVALIMFGNLHQRSSFILWIVITEEVTKYKRMYVDSDISIMRFAIIVQQCIKIVALFEFRTAFEVQFRF